MDEIFIDPEIQEFERTALDRAAAAADSGRPARGAQRPRIEHGARSINQQTVGSFISLVKQWSVPAKIRTMVSDGNDVE
ncbi:hypothetical protein [Natronosalvus amylolyticus]|uniref:hypothetical protein n=1 Tax=Natronosalvus amylolyticus TaxID=2961994 RepID=UPI0020C93E7F|nr:hypothetical protein [Natronosalvus amylolyticus]